MLASYRAKGFTLLEIMLVFVLMGLAASAIAPRLPINSDSQQLAQTAEKLAAQLRFAHEVALTGGQIIGFRIAENQKSYQFVRKDKQQWVSIDNQRYLKPVSLPEDTTLTIQPGDSFWSPALSKANNKEGVENNTPQLFLWRSGEISPATLSICLTEESLCQTVTVREHGEIYVQPS